MDEVVIYVLIQVVELNNGSIESYELVLEDFGLNCFEFGLLQGGVFEENCDILVWLL